MLGANIGKPPIAWGKPRMKKHGSTKVADPLVYEPAQITFKRTKRKPNVSSKPQGQFSFPLNLIPDIYRGKQLLVGIETNLNL